MNLESVLLLNALNATEKAMEKQIKPIDDGGPAFPQPAELDGTWADPETCKRFVPMRGMSLRDVFAGQALAGMLGDARLSGTSVQFATDAYSYADAMLAARKVKP